MSSYKPPYSITPEIIFFIEKIGEAIGRKGRIEDIIKEPRLRRIHRIKTVQSTCAIEGNTLSQEQVSALIDGKRVIGIPSEIKEVTNALKLYDNIDKYDPKSVKDLKLAHRILMESLLDNSGEFRTGGVGIKRDDEIIHMAPPAGNVPYLLNDLFNWLNTSDEHPIILSTVFHYEFEFIHPFPDGNGRLGRFWQTLLLFNWNPLFQLVPIESIIRENQDEYYYALNSSTNSGSVNPFLHFMLKVILDSLNVETPHVAPHVPPHVNDLIGILNTGPLSLAEIAAMLGLKDRKSLMATRIKPAIDAGLIEMTIPNKPRSKNQKYRLVRSDT